MELGKKAIFFSLAAVVFLTVITIVVGSALNTQQIDTGLYTARSTALIRERMEAVYFPMILRSVGTQSMIAVSEDAYARKIPMNISRDFAQATENGTWGGAANYPVASQNLSWALTNLSALMNASGTNLTIRAFNLTIVQTGLTTGYATATFNYSLHSLDNTVRYEREVIVNAVIPLEGTVDYFYSEHAFTRGFSNPKRYIRAYSPKGWNNTEYNQTYQNGFYVLNQRAPSVFSRLQNKTGGSFYGTESLLPPNMSVPINYTVVDWQYFTNYQDNCTYNFNGVISENLTLDFATITEFNLTGGVNVQSDPDCPTAP